MHIWIIETLLMLWLVEFLIGSSIQLQLVEVGCFFEILSLVVDFIRCKYSINAEYLDVHKRANT